MLRIHVEVIAVGMFLFSCSNEKGPSPNDCQLNPVKIVTIQSSLATCGAQDGSLEITASGGNGEYTYSIDGTNFQSGHKFTGLQAGSYNVSVKDMNDCVADTLAMVISNSGMTISATDHSTGCGGSSGSITVTVTGGDRPYQYNLNGGASKSDSVFSGLSSGKYSVTAMDSRGCEVIITRQLLNGTSLNQDVMPILTANCTLSGCHDGKSGLPNWNDKNLVISNASLIRQKTQDKEMPKNGTLSDHDIQTIACWVDDGAKNN